MLAVSAFGAILPFPLVPALLPGAIFEGVALRLADGAGLLASRRSARAHDIPVSGPLPRRGRAAARRPRPRYLPSLALARRWRSSAAAPALSNDRKLALYYHRRDGSPPSPLLRLVAFLLMALARRLPHARSSPCASRSPISTAPGALTPSVVLSLGLGLALLVALAADRRQHSRRTRIGRARRDAELSSSSTCKMPKRRRFRELHQARRRMARSISCRCCAGASSGSRPRRRSGPAEGERRLGAAGRSRHHLRRATPPAARPSSRAHGGRPIMTGRRWFRSKADIASGWASTIGDTITVNVLGRTIIGESPTSARSIGAPFGINFVLVFSPNTFAGAPYTDLATLTFRPAATAIRAKRACCGSPRRRFRRSRRCGSRMRSKRRARCRAARHRDPGRAERRAYRLDPGVRRARSPRASRPGFTTPWC